ncbi:MAG: hypothetical protein GC152_14800 [Alphaproteobacteria bacterium]|nr:hypothetical protein [Alphaproteobacteria bacterium]
MTGQGQRTPNQLELHKPSIHDLPNDDRLKGFSLQEVVNIYYSEFCKFVERIALTQELALFVIEKNRGAVLSLKDEYDAAMKKFETLCGEHRQMYDANLDLSTFKTMQEVAEQKLIDVNWKISSS